MQILVVRFNLFHSFFLFAARSEPTTLSCVLTDPFKSYLEDPLKVTVGFRFGRSSELSLNAVCAKGVMYVGGCISRKKKRG